MDSVQVHDYLPTLALNTYDSFGPPVDNHSISTQQIEAPGKDSSLDPYQNCLNNPGEADQ